jgi:hypothetical protein
MASLPLLRPDPLRLRLVLYSRDKDGVLIPPRTKKNSPQLIPHMKRPILVPSEAYRNWHRGAASQLRGQIPALRASLIERYGYDVLPIKFPVQMSAVFFRDALRGDLMGFIDGVADFLNDDLRPMSQQKRDPGNALKILDNDRWIESLDGSRLSKDANRPRIEVLLEELR